MFLFLVTSKKSIENENCGKYWLGHKNITWLEEIGLTRSKEVPWKQKLPDEHKYPRDRLRHCFCFNSSPWLWMSKPSTICNTINYQHNKAIDSTNHINRDWAYSWLQGVFFDVFQVIFTSHSAQAGGQICWFIMSGGSSPSSTADNQFESPL